MVDVDWEALREAARAAKARAYAPYSHYPVGAAALVSDGRVVTGCNVENAGYGVTLCAECGLVSDLINGGGGRLVAFTCCDGAGERIMPCGRCRQVLNELAGLGGTDPLVWCANGQDAAGVRLSDLLPRAFGPEALG